MTYNIDITGDAATLGGFPPSHYLNSGTVTGETGTWTPQLLTQYSDSDVGVPQPITVSRATYYKLGKMCTVNALISISADLSTAGNYSCRINLPFSTPINTTTSTAEDVQLVGSSWFGHARDTFPPYTSTNSIQNHLTHASTNESSCQTHIFWGHGVVRDTYFYLKNSNWGNLNIEVFNNDWLFISFTYITDQE